MNDAYNGLEPAEIWRHFDALNGIPRGSRHEALARQYVLQVAEGAGLSHAVDARGNTVARVPATDGRADASPIIIQSHLDMVLNPVQSDTYDGLTDPIVPRRDGDRISASGTTLGADNGIGVATALALITTPGLEHGPLELLFTVEEEIGLLGAAELDPTLLSGTQLINLDSEELDCITIGCAGGRTYTIELPVAGMALPDGWIAQQVKVSGLRGGHSGIEIGNARANANKALAGLLKNAEMAGVEFRLVEISGGEARNAIPAAAQAIVAMAAVSLDTFKVQLDWSALELSTIWGTDEPGLFVEVATVETPATCLDIDSYQRVIALVEDLPTGVIAMSAEYAGKVQTSQNVALVQTAPGLITVGVSTRSFLEADLDAAEHELDTAARAAGGACVRDSGYPGWPPAGSSPLLQATTDALTQVLGRKPEIDVVHAGLECGVIAAQLPGLQAVSIGPDIRDAHRTTEHILHASVEPFWRALLLVLKNVS